MAGVPVVKTAGTDPEGDRQVEGEEERSPEEEKEKDSRKEPPAPWCEIASVYRKYFGTEDQLSCTDEEKGWEDLEKVLKGIRDEKKYRLRFLIALVPEPLDSFLPANFDQALQGLQEAYANVHYLSDRLWLPWDDEEFVSVGAHRRFPGVVLFRQTSGPGPLPELATLLLVGESPKSGIHKEAFRNAVRLASIGEPATATVNLPVLGPSFSGSDESLRLALESPRSPTVHFQIATGTATASGLEKKLRIRGSAHADFCRAVLPDEIVEESALQYLRKEMGWDRRRVARLVEADTAYGQRLFEPEGDEVPVAGKRQEPPLLIKFPSGISDLRVAWERNRGWEADQQEAVKAPKWALDLSLAGHEKPSDLVPKFSPLSVQDNDLALSSLLRNISRERIRYVGILASDVRDKLFLARQIQHFFPDVVLFTLEGDLLYSHPEVGEATEGMLVFSSFPLVTEGQLGFPSSSFPPGERRQFSSEFHRGVFQAASYLLGDEHVVRPQIWISAVGNGAMWPLARREIPKGALQQEGVELCGAPLPADSQTGEIDKQDLAERRDLQVLLFLGALILLARVLKNVVVPPDLVRSFITRGGAAGLARAKTRALALGIAVLWISGGTIVALGLMPWWIRAYHPVSELFSFMVVLGYLFLVCLLGEAAWPIFQPAVRRLFGAGDEQVRPALVWAVLGLLVPVVLYLWLRYLAEPGGVALFYLRVRSFSSGLSPFVSLAWVGGALCAWTFFELLRYRQLVRHLSEWPLQKPAEPSLRHLPQTADELSAFLRGTVGPGWRFLLATAIALLSPALLLWHTVQPIAEPKNYGRAFLILCFTGFILSAVSFNRFWKIWRLLEKVLQRLEHSPLTDAFRSISNQVAWNPMKSFWQMPVFNVLLLSLRKLEKIVGRLKAEGEGALAKELDQYRIEIEKALDTAFEKRRKRNIVEEVTARWSIQDTLSKVGHALADRQGSSLVREFLALRIVSYIRHVFSHMRSSLLAAMLVSFLSLMALSSYAFEPKQFVSLAVWFAILAGVLVTLWTFIQMDRNSVLSAISGTKPGQVTFNRSFVLNILTYGILPLLGVIVTQFPDLGSIAVRWLNPLLRVAGID